MNIQAIRTELAGVTIDAGEHVSVTPYDHMPGVAQLPALVVGMPDRISPMSGLAGYYEIELPLVVCVPNPYTVEAEAQLMELALTVANHFRGKRGTAFSTCTFVDIDQVLPVTVGKVEALSAQVHLIILAN